MTSDWRLTDEKKEALLREVMSSPYHWSVVVKEGLEAGADAQARKLVEWLERNSFAPLLVPGFGNFHVLTDAKVWQQLRKDVGLE